MESFLQPVVQALSSPEADTGNAKPAAEQESSGDESESLTAPIETSENSDLNDVLEGEETLGGDEGSTKEEECAVGANVDADGCSNDDCAVKKSTIRFSEIEIREYPIVLGVNPGSMKGVALTIDWQYDEATVVTCDVEEYESSRPERRNMAALSIPSRDREELLRRLGFSRKEVMEGLRQSNLARGSRTRTKERMALAGIEEVCERVCRKVLNLTIRRKAKQQERKMLKEYRRTYAS